MTKKRIKYRAIIYLLSLFYVNFFFLAQYFHHHHSESETSQEKSEIIHSHLFTDFNSPYSEESHSHYGDENHHSHLNQNNYVNSLKPSRNLHPDLDIDFYSILEYSIIDRENFTMDMPTIDGVSKLQLDKYVHSATNISPPLI